MQARGSNGTRRRAAPSGNLHNLSVRMQQAQRYIAIALGFSIPISTALDNVLSALLLLLWLISGEYARKWHTIRPNPVAIAAMLLFALSLVGLMWSTGPLADGL